MNSTEELLDRLRSLLYRCVNGPSPSLPELNGELRAVESYLAHPKGEFGYCHTCKSMTCKRDSTSTLTEQEKAILERFRSNPHRRDDSECDCILCLAGEGLSARMAEQDPRKAE